MNESWKNRKDGYYWVKMKGLGTMHPTTWVVAEWTGEKYTSQRELNWWLPGNEVEQRDNAFEQIHELPLAPPLMSLPDPEDQDGQIF